MLNRDEILTDLLVKLLVEAGIRTVAPLLQHVSKNILLGVTFLMSRLRSIWLPRQDLRVYNASELLDLWRDVYGMTWAWDTWRHSRTIYEGIKLELRGVTLHEYLSTRPGFRYTLRANEYRQRARQYFPGSYDNVTEEFDCLYWGRVHQDIGILDVRYAPLSVGAEKRYLLGATAGEAEGSPSSFPVVVGEELYRKFAEELTLHGAVRVEKIVGQIKVGDEQLKTIFKREFGRDPLFFHADEDQKINVLDRPHRILADAWSVAEIDGENRLLAFTFPLGTVDWETQLMAKCQAVEDFCRKHGGVPLVDFDAQKGRFSTAQFNPGVIQDSYERLIKSLPCS